METEQIETTTKQRKPRRPDKRTIRKVVEAVLSLTNGARLTRTLLITRVAQHLQYPTEMVDEVTKAISDYIDENTGRGKQLSHREGVNGGYGLKQHIANAR